MIIRNTTLVVVALWSLAGCDGRGRPSTPDATGDRVSPNDRSGGESDASDVGADTALRSPGPTISEIIPLPLADYGPAFWIEGGILGDGRLEVVVRARNLTSLVGFAAQVTWDAGLLELLEVTATAPLGGADAVAGGVAAGLGPGLLTLGATRFPKNVDPWNPVPLGIDLPGSVEMGRFILRPLAPGDTTLRFMEGHRVARRPDYAAIPCVWTGLQVRITGSTPGPGGGE